MTKPPRDTAKLGLIPWRRTAPAKPMPQSITVALPSGTAVEVALRRAPNAKRMTLRVPPGHAAPVLTLPALAGRPAAERFAKSQAQWLAARLAERTDPVVLCDGAKVPLRGVEHVIAHTVSGRGTVKLSAEPPTIHVGGRPEHLPRRMEDFFRRTARADIAEAVAEFSGRIGRPAKAIRIKDTRSQWGSCTPAGVLSFSWRLVLAPPFVLRYVAAHEVAHLVELNHSPAFWALNAKLDPNHEAARAWLKAHGRALHAVGGP